MRAYTPGRCSVSITCIFAWKKSRPTIILFDSSLLVEASQSSSFMRFAQELVVRVDVEGRRVAVKGAGKHGFTQETGDNVQPCHDIATRRVVTQ